MIFPGSCCNMERGDLEKLSKQQLVDLVLKLQRPPKTSRTSSKPPSTDRKARREHAKPGCAKPGHEGPSRSLHENPDEIVDHRPDVCLQCHGHLNADLAGDVIGEYDEIEVPPIKPFVRRHRRFCVCCPHCSSKVKAPLPVAAHGILMNRIPFEIVTEFSFAQTVSVDHIQ